MTGRGGAGKKEDREEVGGGGREGFEEEKLLNYKFFQRNSRILPNIQTGKIDRY